MNLDELRSGIAQARRSRLDARAALERTFAQPTPSDDEEQARARAEVMEGQRADIATARASELSGFAGELDPRRFVGELDGAIPILLMPLRLQTRFRGNELLIRVYPDDLSVDAHERRLTSSEHAAGDALWAADVELRRTLWRQLASQVGLNRAMWVVVATSPERGQRPEELDTIVRVPAAFTLPERLIFRVHSDDDTLLGPEFLGAPIPDGLELGFDPTRLGPWTRTDANLSVPPELLWQSDFDEAVKVGMGVAIPLGSVGSPQRIGRVIALGVRLATNADESARLLESLIEGHRYADGFALVPQGTPTNVDTEAAGRNSRASDEASDRAFDTIMGPGVLVADAGDTHYEDEPDGLRLAHALGITPETLRYVEHADGQDGGEAIAMKRALWAGTLGYHLQHLLFPEETIEYSVVPDIQPPPSPEQLILDTRFFFTHFVFGRGPLPAFRVGAQPYGVLPVSGDMLTSSDPHEASWGDGAVDAFVRLAHDKMLILVPTWRDLFTMLPTARSGQMDSARFVDVLSRQASAVEFYGERMLGLDYLVEAVDMEKDAKQQAGMQVFRRELVERRRAFHDAYPGLLPRDARIFKLSFVGGEYWDKVIAWKDVVAGLADRAKQGSSPILDKDVIDDLPLSESQGIDPAYPNYLDWLARSSFDALTLGLKRPKRHPAPDEKDPNESIPALLYLSLRHSLLVAHAFLATRVWTGFRTNKERSRRYEWADFLEKNIVNVTYQPEATPWDLLHNSEPEGTFIDGRRVRGAVVDLVATREQLRDTLPDWKNHFGDIDEVFRALQRFADPTFPTARLERLYTEHLDLAGYRLDAWLTGWVYQRLLAARVWSPESRAQRPHPFDAGTPGATRTRPDLNHRPLGPYAGGVYLGAYGWVEGITRDQTAEVKDLPPELAGDLIPPNANPITRDPANAGLIHAPSLNHAVTAAILRSASITQTDTESYNVDLTSARTREALWLMDGVRNGQSIGALLGYRFERSLRETDVRLLQFLPQIRARYPLPTHAETEVVSNDGAEVEPRDVVNGLLIVQKHREGTLAADLGLTVELPLNEAEVLAQIAGLAQRLADVFDACGDLMLAEGVHQAAQGNMDRARGMITATGAFTHVPSEFDVITTPRSGRALSHRVMLAMDGAGAAAPAVTATPRARLEPQLNSWIAERVGTLSDITCRVVHEFVDGAGVPGTDEQSVSFDQLGLEPLDLVFVADDGGQAELLARIGDVTRRGLEEAHPDAVIGTITVDTTSAAGQLLLLARLRRLLSAARPATRRDLVASAVAQGMTAGQVDGIDADELTLRVLGVSSVAADAPAADSLWASFQTALGALKAATDAPAEELVDLLRQAATFGLVEAIPQKPAVASGQREALRAQADRVVSVMETRQAAALAARKGDGVPVNDVVSICTEVTRVLLGGVFPLMPNIVSFDAASTPEGADGSGVEDWLFRMSVVRERIGNLQHARVLAEELGEALPSLQVRQWPAGAKWIGAELQAGSDLPGDLVSIVVQPIGPFAGGNPIKGLVLDEWRELVPGTHETTGVAFHCDAPNAEPPQTVLLAVCRRAPQNNGHWAWQELVDCVTQALVLAKMRAVGPDELRQTPLDLVLPATTAAEARYPSTISNSYFANISREAASINEFISLVK